jgi:hypothetical protein
MIYDVRASGFDSLAPSYIDKDMKKVLADTSKEKLDKYKTHGRVAAMASRTIFSGPRAEDK